MMTLGLDLATELGPHIVREAVDPEEHEQASDKHAHSKLAAVEVEPLEAFHETASAIQHGRCCASEHPVERIGDKQRR